MSTHSYIGIVKPTGEIESIYCNFDGYLEHVGLTLLKHYSNVEKVQELISLGDMSSLADNVSPGENIKHSFSKPAKNVCVFYGRDNGEDNVSATVLANVEEWEKKHIEAFSYLFRDGQWFYREGDDDLSPLTEEDCGG